MLVSIETPVFKGGWLRPCIDSVLYQSSPNWKFSLLWDGGDAESRRILEELDRRNHPNVTVYFGENRGIARARRFLTERSEGEFILALDDDDALPFYAVERFLSVAEELPWSSVIRGQRKIIAEDGRVVDTPPWFPFEPRHYQDGMVTDLLNHTQPYLIRRSAYNRTTGWEGFEDFGFAGEDCDIYLKLEEVGTIELLDEVLYYYRVHSKRASLELTPEGAFEMWRRLADKTIARIGLPLRRVNDDQPFRYERLSRPDPTVDLVDFIIVAEEGKSQSIAATRAGQSLRRSGFSGDALHLATCEDPSDLNEGFRRTSRPFVCFVDAAVEVDRTERFETLLRLMAEHDADLVGPKLVTKGERDVGPSDDPTSAPRLGEKLLVARREVVLATGGFDEGYEHGRTAMVDFCLSAQRRDFKCAYFGTVGLMCDVSGQSQGTAPDLRRLQQKWAGYPDLFAGFRDTKQVR